MRVRSVLALFGLVAVVFAFGHSAPTLAAGVTNGGFETGDFSGWNVFNQPGSNFSASWYVYSGTTAPVSGLPIPAPPQGTFAAISDQFGPSTSILYRDIALEPNMPHTLSFFYYYHVTGIPFCNLNIGAPGAKVSSICDSSAKGSAAHAGASSPSVSSIEFPFLFCTPATLDFTVGCNEQNRVDLVSTSASLLSVNPSDLLMPLFRSNDMGIPGGQPGFVGPYHISFDISALAGQTVRLRVASVQTQFFQEVGIDAVSVDGGTTFTVGGAPAHGPVTMPPGFPRP